MRLIALRSIELDLPVFVVHFVFQAVSSSSMAVDTLFGSANTRLVATQQALENAVAVNNTANTLAGSLASATALAELQGEHYCDVRTCMPWVVLAVETGLELIGYQNFVCLCSVNFVERQPLFGETTRYSF